MTTNPPPDRVTAIYDAIDAFQREHRTGGGLQHAQIRALLAEHLDRALPAAPALSGRALRDRIASALARTQLKPPFPHCLAMADAVLAVLHGLTLRELELLGRPNTPPSRPEPRLPDHTVNEEEAPNPIKQRADCTELEWAEQERARFERLYTRETVRGDLAEARADTAARDADIYQQRLERLSDGYTRERKRAERAEAEAEQLRTSQSTNTFTAADLVAALRAAGAERNRLDAADRTTVLNAAAQRLYTSLFPAVYNDLGQKAAEGVNRAVFELRRLAAETQQTQTETGLRPARGDQFEAWLKTQRDEYEVRSSPQWGALNEVLDTYRLHADTGTPLSEHVCEANAGDCDCQERK